MEANDSSIANYSQVESANAINISMFEDSILLKTHKKQSRSLALNINSRNQSMSNSFLNLKKTITYHLELNRLDRTLRRPQSMTNLGCAFDQQTKSKSKLKPVSVKVERKQNQKQRQRQLDQYL